MPNRHYYFVPVLLFVQFVWTAAQAQQAASPAPAFETASIRPAHLTNGCFSMLPPGGTHYELTCMTLRNLIESAFNTSYIDGGGSALDTYYDLRATTPEGTLWTMQSVGPMVHQLLVERFHLVTHAGQRQLSGFALTLAKNGPKIHPVAPEAAPQGQKAGQPSPNFSAPGRLQGRGVDPAGIAGLLSVVVQAPVVDRTGLTGVFDINLRFAPENSPNSDLPSFTTAVEEQLGLKLRPEKVTVDTVVIDHVDETPTSN